MKIILFFLLVAFSYQEKTIFGEYQSFQCGEYKLKLEPDSSFNLYFDHFDSNHKRTSSGKYYTKKDSLILKEYNSKSTVRNKIDSADLKKTYTFIILSDGKLKNQSLYCGDLSVRTKENWSFWKKIEK